MQLNFKSKSPDSDFQFEVVVGLAYNISKKSFKSTLIMYDTVKLKKKITPQQYLLLIENLRLLNKVSNREYESTGITATQTTYKDCFFSLTEKYLTVTVSLPKLLLGTNQLTFTRNDTVNALLKLQELLGVGIMDAVVQRIDIAHNFLLNLPIETYFKALCNKEKMKRWTIGHESLYFTNQGKRMELNFYNKTAQLRDTDQLIMPEFVNKNLLRYELRIKSNPAKVLGQPFITCATLIDKAFYQSIVSFWYNEYRSILKLSYAPATNYGKNLTEFSRYLMTAGIEKIGASEIYDIVNCHPAFKAAPKVRYNIKKMLKDLIQNRMESNAAEAVAELDDRMLYVLENAA